MPVYTVELDGKQYDLEGDHPPSEAEARAAIGGGKTSTPPPSDATAGMRAPSTANGPDDSGWRLTPELEAKLAGVPHMDQSPFMLAPGSLATDLASKVPGMIGRAATATKAAMVAHPVASGAILGGVEGAWEGNGDPKRIAKGAFYGAVGGGALNRMLNRIGGGQPSATSVPAPTVPAPTPVEAPVPSGDLRSQLAEMLKTPAKNPDQIEQLIGQLKGQSSPAPAPAAAPTPQASLQHEMMAREPDWRTTDAVPIDAMKRDITNGGSIIEAGESRVGLGERLANLMKKPTPSQLAEADRLARAMRQRMHISGQ